MPARRRLLRAALVGWTLLVSALGLSAPRAHAAAAAQVKRQAVAALRGGRIDLAIEAVARLGEIGGRAGASALVDLLEHSGDETLLGAIERALIGLEGEDAAAVIGRKLRGGPVGRRLALCDVAARRTDRHSLEGLLVCLRHRDEALVRAATRALVARRAPEAIEPLIAQLEKREGKPGSGAGLIRRALRELTGKELFFAIEWRGWWATHQRAALPSRAEAQRALAAARHERGRSRARFFGRTLDSDRIVFVIDVSGSMSKRDPLPHRSEPREGDGGEGAGERTVSRVRLERAKAELLGAIEGLPEHARFTIIAYAGYLPPGSAQPQGVELPNEHNWARVLSKRLMKASAANKAKARAFVEQLRALGSTFTGRALEMALEIKDVDLIVLLSDGAPTEWIETERGSIKHLGDDEVRARIRAANRRRRVTIDAFGFAGEDFGGGGDDRFTAFMKGVAEDNGGRFFPIE